MEVVTYFEVRWSDDLAPRLFAFGPADFDGDKPTHAEAREKALTYARAVGGEVWLVRETRVA